jgi:hypothetical protein
LPRQHDITKGEATETEIYRLYQHAWRGCAAQTEANPLSEQTAHAKQSQLHQ